MALLLEIYIDKPFWDLIHQNFVVLIAESGYFIFKPCETKISIFLLYFCKSIKEG